MAYLLPRAGRTTALPSILFGLLLVIQLLIVLAGESLASSLGGEGQLQEQSDGVRFDDSSTSMVRVEPTENEKLFWEWLVSNGADVSNIVWPAVHPLTGSRGVMAARDIPGTLEGDHVYVKVPERLMVTEEKALSDKEFGPAIASTLSTSVDEITRIALYLVFQSTKTTTFFYPYTLVLQEPSVLAVWTEEERREVQDAKLVEKCSRQLEEAKRQHRQLSKKHFPPEVFTWEKFYWALANVHQRAFGIRNDDNEHLYNAMVPGADLLNHVNIGTHYKMVDDMAAYVLYPVDQSIRKGEECYNGYGYVSNDHLLQSYGFALKGNRFDMLEIQSPSMYAMLQDISAHHSIPGFLHPGQAIRQFQGESWKQRLRQCRDALVKRLEYEYTTTLADDFAKLSSLEQKSSPHEEKDWRLRFALHHRIGQKAIAESYAAYCKEAEIDVDDSMSIAQFDLLVVKAVHRVELRDRAAPRSNWFELHHKHGDRMHLVELLMQEAKRRLEEERKATKSSRTEL